METKGIRRILDIYETKTKTREELIERLKHYYEIGRNNCAMTNETWIEELAEAMLDKNYKKKFIAEHEEYKKMLNE
jgi:hypothetical protein